MGNTRLQLKNSISGVTEYAPVINEPNNGYTGIVGDEEGGWFKTIQWGNGYRLQFLNNDLNPSLTITTSLPTSLTIARQYLIKVSVILNNYVYFNPNNPEPPPIDVGVSTLKIVLGASDNGTNSLVLTDVNGEYEAIVTCSANNINLIGSNTIIGSFQILSLSITDVDTEDLTELDLYEDLPFPLTYSADDITNLDSRNSEFSKTITIPGTKRNNKIFNHVFEIESDSNFLINKKLDVIVLNDGITVFDGILKINRIVVNDLKNIDYEILLLSKVSDFLSRLGENLLEDLDFGDYNHILNRENQYNSWGSSFAGAGGVIVNGVLTDNFTETYRGNPSPNGRGYLYCLICNGKGNYTYNILADKAGVDGSLPQYRVQDIALGFYAYEYMLKIASSVGFTISSDFFESALFKKMVIPPSSKQFLLSQSEVQARLFDVLSNDKSIVMSFGLTNSGISQVDTVRYNDIVTDTSGGYFAGGDGVWYVQKAGTYNFKAKIGLRWEYSNIELPYGGVGASYPVYTNFYLEKGYLQVVRLRNNILSIVGEQSFEIEQDQSPINSPTGFSATYEFNVDALNIECLVGDQIYVQLDARHLLQTDGSPNYNPDHLLVDQNQNLYPAQGLFINLFDIPFLGERPIPTWIGNNNNDFDSSGTAELVMLSNYSFLNEVVNNGFTDGDYLNVNSFIPKGVRQVDFFKSILKMCNGFVLTSKENPNNLITDPREDILSNEFISLDQKLDTSIPIEIEPLTELDAKRYVFEYTKDSDYLNELVFNSSKSVYGTKSIDFDNDFLTGTKNIQVVFSPTVTYRQIYGKLALPTITDESGSPIDSNIRILFYNYADGNEPQWTHIWQDGATTNYTPTYVPALSMFDDLYDPNESLEFGVSALAMYDKSPVNPNIILNYTNNTLFNKYYSKYTWEITNKNSKLITANFKLSPIDIFNLDFTKLYFFNNHWCRLYSVENYDPFKDESTKVKLLKYNDGPTFEPTQNVIDGGDGWYEDFIGDGNA